jgi:ankyrin repeat protein
VADDVSKLEPFLPDAASLERPIDWDGIQPRYGENPFLGRVPPIWVAVEAGATNSLRWLLERGAKVNTRLERQTNPLRFSGGTLLEFATRLPDFRDRRASVVRGERWTARDAEVVRLLLHHGADVFAASSRRGGGYVPLSLERRVFYPELLTLLLTHSNPNTARDSNGTSLLHIAAAHEHIVAMDHLLRAGLSPTATNQDGLTPMQACFVHSHPDRSAPVACVQRLRDAGAPMDLWSAAGLGDAATLDRLLSDAPTAASQRDAFGRTPLHYAASTSQLDAMGLLLQKGADPDAGDRLGNTALHLAAQWGLMDMLRILVKNHASLDALNQSGETALVLGIGRIEVAEFLLEAGASAELVGAGVVRPLVRAIEWHQASPPLLRLLIRHGAKLDRPAPDGRPLVFVAMEQPHDLAEIASLIRFGADLETQDSQGNTLLLRASLQTGPDEMVYTPPMSLVREFATRPDWRREVHDWLVARNVISPKPASTQELVSRFLLKLGANPRATNHLGETALHVLARRSTGLSTNMALALLQGGVDPLARDRDGNTFLHRIANPGEPFAAGEAPSLNAGNLKTIFEAWPPSDALISATNHAGQTAAQMAIASEHRALAEVLIQAQPRSHP